MHLPFGGEEGVHRRGREEIGRAVRPVEHADIPDLAITRDNPRLRHLGRRNGRRCGAGGERRARYRQHVAGAQRASGMAAELPEREGGPAAEILRHVDAVTHRQITATACTGAAQRQRLSGPGRDRLPAGDRLAIELCVAVRAGEREDGVAVKAQRRPLKREFKSGGLRRVTDDTVGQPEGVIVHRPGRRYADIPVAQTPRIILHAAPGARLQHFDGVRVVAHLIQQARPHGGVFKRLQTNNLAQIIKIGGDTVQTRGVKCLTKFRKRLRAVVAVNDDFGDHRIVKRADLRAGADPAIDAHAVREVHVGKLPRRRLEVFQRIFSIETHFY
ncbi:hypothetical protein BN131_374 [Cronobacter malonaticus 681]|nr:hypothetical protein BN131_374 [Cronobacter malonaticus 681]